MAKKKNNSKAIDKEDLERLKRKRSKLIEELEDYDEEDPKYEKRVKQIESLTSLIERLSPTDKISKADWLKTGVAVGTFIAAFVPELKGHVVLKSPLRRLGGLPRLWGNDLASSDKSNNKK